jgi:ABC-type multidrug transport system fused ATPase/permease subunit
VIIAHRLSTVRNADRILKIEAGRLIELDRHLFLTHHKQEKQQIGS